VRVGVVPELDDERMALEEGLHDAALNAAAAAVNQADFRETGLLGGMQVLVDHGRNVRGREGVQVELGGDGDPDGLGVVHVPTAYFFS